jgi:guanylate kinase
MGNENEKRILIIAGPTGSGESTITKEIIKQYPIFTRLMTATTRKPRLNDKDGIDYFFFSENQFKKEMIDGRVIEHTFVPGRGVYYGTYKPDLEKKIAEGHNIIVNPDVVGARYYKEQFNATTIFIKAESLGTLKDRLIGRDPHISEEELTQRLKAAELELANEEAFYDYIIVNKQGKLAQTVEEIVSILQKEGYRLS